MENKIFGTGLYTWLDGRSYVGHWKENNMEGIGIYKWSDGRSYEGEYVDDKKHGYGIYRWADGRAYAGYWNLGKQHGLGVYTVAAENRKKHGLWEEGKRIEWFTSESQSKVNNHEIDYIQYFKLESSKNTFTGDETFNQPDNFDFCVKKVEKEINDL